MNESVFMVMPFKDEVASSAYRHSTKPVVESFGFRIYRSDEIFSANPVFDDIVMAVEQSSIVIVDISGRNPNCFYELGIAHTVKRNRTIMITHDEYEDIPFDIAHFRILKYENTIEGKSQYEDNLRKTMHSITTGLPELYQGEFETIVDIFVGLDNEPILCTLLGISKASEPLAPDSRLFVEGHYRDEDRPIMAAGGLDELEPFINRDYLQLIDDKYSLTAKGQAFVDYLSSKGYEVDRLNEEIFTPGYISWFDRIKEKKNRK